MLGSIFFSLLVVELGLRVECYWRLEELEDTEFSASESESLAIHSDIPGLVYVFRPEMTWTRPPYDSKTNARGYFDDDHALQKPGGVFRIVVIGDSVAEGYSVRRRESFIKVLEQKLNGVSAENTYEVIVLARSGYGTSQQLVILQREALEYDPDLILWSYVLNDPENPFYHGDFMGALFVRKPRLYLLDRVDCAWFFLKENIKARGGPQKYDRRLHYVYWDQVTTNLAQIGRISRENNVPIVFLIHPWFEEGESIEDYRSLALHADLTDLASRNGLIELDLFDAYRGRVFGDLYPPNDPCHLNVQGHRLTAEFLFDELVVRGLVP